jgi:hypothetical protein
MMPNNSLLPRRLWAPLLLVLPIGAGACIGPAGGPQAAPGANNANAAPAAVAPTAGADGKALVWNGEGVGSSAKQWTSCGKKDAPCKTTLGAMPGVGHDASMGLRFHGEGADWLGGGWNWFGWWPENAGSDVSAFKNLSFWLKVEAKSPAEAPDPGSLAVALGCSKGKKTSATVLLAKYDAKSFDGAWHQMSIPLTDFLKDAGRDFDLKSTWELRVSSWSGDEKNFNLYFDDIGFDNK